MHIQSGKTRLFCQLDGAGPGAPLAVILHGITGNLGERHIEGVAGALGRAGFGTLRADLYGHGKSEGAFEEHTLFKWVGNTLDVLAFARSVSRRIILCGHSQGGLTAMLAAAAGEAPPDGLILLSPACQIPDGARRGELLGMRFDPARVPDRLELPNKGLSVGRDYILAAQRIRIEEAQYSGPVLIVHGEADQTVPVSWSRELARRYPDGSLVLIPGDTHCYDHHLDAVTDAVEAWAARIAGTGP